MTMIIDQLLKKICIIDSKQEDRLFHSIKNRFKTGCFVRFNSREKISNPILLTVFIKQNHLIKIKN